MKYSCLSERQVSVRHHYLIQINTFSIWGTITFEPVVENFIIEEAGEVTQNAGHHHLLVNTDPVDTGTVIPSDDQHLHFGGGTELPEVDASELGTGDYEVIIQVANGAHEAYPLATEPSPSQSKSEKSRGSAGVLRFYRTRSFYMSKNTGVYRIK